LLLLVAAAPLLLILLVLLALLLLVRVLPKRFLFSLLHLYPTDLAPN